MRRASRGAGATTSEKSDKSGKSRTSRTSSKSGTSRTGRTSLHLERFLSGCELGGPLEAVATLLALVAFGLVWVSIETHGLSPSTSTPPPFEESALAPSAHGRPTGVPAVDAGLLWPPAPSLSPPAPKPSHDRRGSRSTPPEPRLGPPDRARVVRRASAPVVPALGPPLRLASAGIDWRSDDLR